MPFSPSETATYLRRRTDALAHFVNTPNVHERLAEGTIHPVRAMLIRAILATPGMPAFLHERTQTSQYSRAGYDVLGTGYHAITVADGPMTVRKFYRHTAQASEREQQAQIATWEAKQEIALKHLGAYTVPQFFSIEENPLKREESIITATQARIESTGAIDIFSPKGTPDSASDFFEDSFVMQQESLLPAVPDLYGRNNAVIEKSTGTIKLIDPIVLVNNDADDEGGYLRVARFLNEHHEQSARN